MKGFFRLVTSKPFGGLGNGRFFATGIADLEIKLLDIWCLCPTYVVPDEVLEPRYDILVGHDFIQVYDIGVRLKKRGIRIDREALLMGLRVRAGGQDMINFDR